MKRITDLDLGLEPSSEDPKERLQMAVQSMTDSREQPKLENWTLRYFSDAYNRLANSEKLEWVERGTPPAPDYLVFTRPDAAPIPIEVTELLDPGRKRREEYKSAWEQAERTGDYVPDTDLPDELPPGYEEELIAKARQLLSQKFSKPYPKGTWLVVYFNPELRPLFEEAPAFALRIMQSAINSLPPPERIVQAWMLTQDMQITRLM
jgi:hypothetical protein